MSSDGFDLPDGRRILSSMDVYHMSLNRAKTSEMLDMVHRKFGHAAFAEMIKTPLGDFDSVIYKYVPEFTFSSDRHIMAEVQRLINHLHNYPDHPDIKVAESMLGGFRVFERRKKDKEQQS